ncbi:SDR family oxidoreductase [Saccharothrix syringae]|nr:SDR family oxidoreductase [Saccharothrix syringae]
MTSRITVDHFAFDSATAVRVHPPARRVRKRVDVVSVAITGGTGFLGLHVVRELLRDRNTPLILLSNAGSPDALGRLISFLELCGTPAGVRDEVPARVTVVEVDVSVSRLGLSDADFRRLADQVDAVWHCAGDITLDGEPAALRRVNVDGTRHVLELVSAGRREPVLFHVSTAFVAGARRDRTAFEDELDPAGGFENAYERSKYEAEVLVREWSARSARPAVVFRPSILITDRPPHPALPAHPLEFLNRWLRARRGLLGRGGPRAGGELPEVRIPGRAEGHLNFMPVEASAEVMVRLSRRPPASGVDTYHVVHHHDVPIPVLLEVLQHLVAVRLTLVPASSGEPAASEQRVVRLFPGFAPYLHHKRRFDDTRTRTALGDLPHGVTVDLAYMLSGLQVTVRC